MDDIQYAKHMVDRLPAVLQEGGNIGRVLHALAREMVHMDRATALLMRSRWYDLARGWADDDQRAQRMATELGAIGALYGLDPSPDETAAQFRRHLYDYIAIHRVGLGTAEAILGLVALEYRAEALPEVKWHAGAAVGTFRVRDAAGERHTIRVQLIDSPPTPRTVVRDNVAAAETLLLTNTGLDPVIPEITLIARDHDVAVPVLSHEETSLRVMFVGRVPAGSALTLRHGNLPLLDRQFADGSVFVSQATRFDNPPDVRTQFYSPPAIRTRFSSFERNTSLPVMPTGENHWQHNTLSRAELESFLTDQPDRQALIQKAEEARGGHAVDLRFAWREATPATFTLRIPATYLPPPLRQLR